MISDGERREVALALRASGDDGYTPEVGVHATCGEWKAWKPGKKPGGEARGGGR